MNDPKQIVSSLFDVSWIDSEKGFMKCPGSHLHTGKNNNRDCKIYLDVPPSIFCFHGSCSQVVEDANYKLRRALWDGKVGEKREFTSQEKDQIRKDIEKRKKDEHLKNWGKDNKERIIKKHWWPVGDVFHESPISFDNPKDGWKLLLSMFDSQDVIWNGEPTDSGEGKENHFRTVEEWFKEVPKDHFTCPSCFKPGVNSRSNENVLIQKFLVIESDVLSKDESCSLFKWMSDFMNLRAIVFTGGKSMHGWFQYPSKELFQRLKLALPEMGCDKALFKSSQPVRMPGIKRGEEYQSLYWFKK